MIKKKLQLKKIQKRSSDYEQRRTLELTRKQGSLCILSRTSNNIFVNVLDFFGNTLFFKSCGSIKYHKKRKKAEPFSATLLGNDVRSFLNNKNLVKVHLVINRLPFRSIKVRMFLKGLFANRSVHLDKITFRYTKAHNGCREKKQRRL